MVQYACVCKTWLFAVVGQMNQASLFYQVLENKRNVKVVWSDYCLVDFKFFEMQSNTIKFYKTLQAIRVSKLQLVDDCQVVFTVDLNNKALHSEHPWIMNDFRLLVEVKTVDLEPWCHKPCVNKPNFPVAWKFVSLGFYCKHKNCKPVKLRRPLIEMISTAVSSMGLTMYIFLYKLTGLFILQLLKSNVPPVGQRSDKMFVKFSYVYLISKKLPMKFDPTPYSFCK